MLDGKKFYDPRAVRELRVSANTTTIPAACVRVCTHTQRL
jgi:hypothetical protein